MTNNQEIIKLIFGFKVKYLRQQKQLSYHRLSEMTKLSISYLHDIENGKKYPKADKIMTLAEALEVEYDYLVSLRASKKLQPIIDLFNSDFYKMYPLEVFGLKASKLMELFSKTPDKINAFISTIIKITRTYQLSQENFYQAALRSYQDMHDNYFEDIELAVKKFRKKYKIGSDTICTTPLLEELLDKKFGITTDRTILASKSGAKGIRSFYLEKKKILCINNGLVPAQENFLIGRELAFQYLKIKERPYETRLIKADTFELLLNNFKASYFSVALLMDEDAIANDFSALVKQKKWNGDFLISLLDKYDVTPEMLFQRLSNVLPHHFGIGDLFFLRITGEPDLKSFMMTKELHLLQLHSPHANELNEHYCRRWISINIIKKLRALQIDTSTAIVDAQVSNYWETENSYLCLSLAKKNALNAKEGTSVTIGLLVNDKLKQLVGFLDDPDLKVKEVNTTCERCSMPNCGARIAPPIIIEQENEQLQLEQTLNNLASEFDI